MSFTFFFKHPGYFSKRNSTGFDFYHFSLLILSNIVLIKNNSSPEADFYIFSLLRIAVAFPCQLCSLFVLFYNTT